MKTRNKCPICNIWILQPKKVNDHIKIRHMGFQNSSSLSKYEQMNGGIKKFKTEFENIK